MSKRLSGKVALITGAGSGIGAEMARQFAAEGATVAVADISAEAASRVASEIQAAGLQASYVHADISRAREVDAMFEMVVTKHGGLDILVNNAYAVFNDVTMVDLREEDWEKTIAVCLKGPFLCVKRALPLMRSRGGGSIVSMSSVNALMGVGETAYTAAKGGLIAMMRLVATEYGAWNIRSNTICPGTIATDSCIAYWQKFPAGFERLVNMYPLGRIGTPADVAQFALFLASDESKWMTGGVHVIDGGLTAGHKFEQT